MAEKRVQRRLAAILAADVVGYSRLMGMDEAGTRARFNAHLNELIEPAIESRRGRIVKTTGDGLLVEFASVVDAVECAVAIQKDMAGRNTDEPTDQRIEFRIGVNLGDVIIEGDDIHGDGVNVAARLEGLCEAGSVYVSGTVYDHAAGKLAASFEDLGEKSVKNIAKPVRVYRTWAHSGDVAKPADTAGRLPISDKPSIAVLPFQNMSGDPEQEYFSDGITEDIITALSRIRQIFVVARNTTFTYKGQAVDVRAVASDLGVRYVLEGSVRKVGNRLRISAQLIDGNSGNHLWAERYDRELEDIFDLQDEITRTVVGAIEPELGKAERERSRIKRPESLGAWDHYQRGMANFYRHSKEDFIRAKECYWRTIELDPDFAAAYAAIANLNYSNIFFGHSDAIAADRDEALQVSKRAVVLDGDDPAAHTALGAAYVIRGENELAVDALQTAIRLNPSSARAFSFLGHALTQSNRFEEAITSHKNAIELGARDPVLPNYMGRLGSCYLQTGQYELALEWTRRATRRLGANIWIAYAQMACALVGLERLDEAREAVNQLAQANPKITAAYIDEVWTPFFGPEVAARFIEQLCNAGLLES